MKRKNEETPVNGAEENVAGEGVQTKTPEVSEAVDAILKKFSQYDELYVDAVGGVYTKDSQPTLVEGAILYQNPYYNK